MNMGTYPPWSELPQELLSAIAELLRSHSIDILSFRSVCKSWCSSSSSIPRSILLHPLPLIIPSVPSSLRSRCYIAHDVFSVLSVTVAYAVRAPVERELPSWMPKAWMVFVDQTNPNKVSIRDPFAQTAYAVPANFPESLDLVSFRAVELGRFYNLSYLSTRCVKRTKASIYFGLVRKVVLFSNDDGLFAVVLSDDGKLGLLRLGIGDNIGNLGAQTQWEIIHEGKHFHFDDIIEFKGRMLCIDRRGRVYRIDIGSSQVMMNVIVPSVTGGGGRRKRLVESLGRLHIVVRCNVREGTNAVFRVFQLDENVQKWVEVKNLGGQTFFFGLEFSFSVSAEKLHGLYGKNCVLFKEKSFLSYTGNDDDSRLFLHLGCNDLHIGVWNLENAAHLGVIGSHTGYSDVIWPPPSWIWRKDKSQRLEAIGFKLDLFQKRIPNKNLKAFEKLFTLQKENAIVLTIQIRTKKELLKQVRHMDNQMKEIEMIAESFEQSYNSEKLHNQVGTSTLATVEQYLSIDSLEKAMKKSNYDLDWFAMENKINAFILQFEENLVDFENALIVNNF